MTLQEVYAYYGENWCEVMRELKLGMTTIQYWRKIGFIPVKAQMKIEKKTNGLFKARMEDAEI